MSVQRLAEFANNIGATQDDLFELWFSTAGQRTRELYDLAK